MKGVNCRQNSCMTLIGVHSTMHLIMTLYTLDLVHCATIIGVCMCVCQYVNVCVSVHITGWYM